MVGNVAVFSGFSVNDLAAARHFYGDALGIPIEDEPRMGFRLKFPSGHTVFLYEKPDHVPAQFTVLNFVVEDIDATIAELSSKGITMLHYDGLPAPQDEKGVLRGKSAGYGPDIAWFTDPSGNVLSILEN